MTYDWSKKVKMTVPVGLNGWQQRGSLTINGRTTEFPVGVETELPEPVAERVKALMADAEKKAEHVQPLKPWMQLVTGADGVARWEDRLAYAETEETVILPETTVEWQGEDPEGNLTTPFAAKMVAGQEYTVVWNGDEYKCVAQAVDNGEGLVAVILGDTESFPFSIVQLPEEIGAQIGVCAFVQSAEPLTSATLSITGMVEKVKPIDPKYLPAGAGGGETVILAETELEYAGTDMNGIATHRLSTPLAAPLKTGMACDVMYNGKLYICTAKTIVDGGVTAVVLGNAGMFANGAAGSGEPFIIIQMPDELAAGMGYLVVNTNDGAESVTLSITAKTTGGSSAGGVLYITAVLDDSTANPAIAKPSHTFADVDAAVAEGKYCILKLDGSGGTGAAVFYIPLASKENTEDGEVYKFVFGMYGATITIAVNRVGWMISTTM